MNRWIVCGLLFAATTINYMDRQVLGILAAPLQREIGWSEAEYGYIVTAFSAAYAIGQLGFGRIIDRLGTRLGYLIAVGCWSVAAAAHGAARSTVSFGAARFFLGLGEAGNFPAAVKTVAEWFPRKERAFAIGLFNCGSNVGAVLTPLVVPWIALRLGWRWAFVLLGALGLFWIAGWLLLYQPRQILKESEQRVPWQQLLGYRQTWALVIARFLTDPVWWFYLYWVPKFLNAKHGLTLEGIGLPLVAIYLAADGGSILGGWLSSALIRRGATVNAARKLAILACALLVVPIAFASNASHTWVAVALIGLAAAGHQGWAANLFASIADIFPPDAVSSVTGITGFGGAAGGMLAATMVGLVLQATGSYLPMFVWAGCSYLCILGVIQWLIPKIEPIPMERA